MNMANVHFDSFALGFEDACFHVLKLIDERLGQTMLFLKTHKLIVSEHPEVEKYLIGLLGTFKQTPKVLDVTSTTKSSDFDPFVPKMIAEFRQAMDGRLDFGILDIKFAWTLSQFYIKINNDLKAYHILRRAFMDNLKNLDTFYQSYIKVVKVRPLVLNLMGPENLESYEDTVSQRRSLKEWLDIYRSEEQRHPILKHYIMKCDSVLSYSQIAEIVKLVAELAQKHKQFDQSLYFYEILLQMVEIDLKLSYLTFRQKPRTKSTSAEETMIILKTNRQVYNIYV